MKYRWRAVNAHGLHSPFLFSFYKEVIKPAKHFQLDNVEQLRSALKANHEVIDLFDLKSQQQYRRTISSIAKTSLSTKRFSAFLFKLIEWLKVTRVMETGTSLGINALYMAGPEKVKKLITIEASPIIATIAKKQFNQLLQHKIEIKQGAVQEILHATLVKEKPVLCFIDADHRSSVILEGIEMIMEQVPEIRCIVVHDIYWSPDMKEAWDTIIDDKRLTLTVDLFQAGIIFPNLDMPNQHFIIRF